MCGIVGVAGLHKPEIVRRMADAISHRGPDGSGFRDCPQAGIHLGMRRLAIIDLETGDQPLCDSTNRVHIVFNGEVYNHLELRSELESFGYCFKTKSDTEVVLNSYLAWGRSAWSRLHGMFAIAVLDERELHPSLILVRDRPGIKPLYFSKRGRALVFASEIKSLQVANASGADIDLSAIHAYLALRYVPGPGSLFSSVERLQPGHELIWKDGATSVHQWWSPPDCQVVQNGMTEASAASLIGEALRRSVRRHMIADVPVGAFLSGGIDSSLIVALMCEVASEQVKTFSIGFTDFPDDDRQMAARTAHLLGTNHHSIECKATDFSDLPDLVYKLDEPIGDAIVVPMAVLAREARREVKVVLSGEGADELMGGYMFHRKLQTIERVRRYVPRVGFKLAAKLVSAVPVALLERIFDYPGALGTAGRRKISALIADLATASPGQLYRRAISLFDPEDFRARSGCGPLAALSGRYPGQEFIVNDNASSLQGLISMQWSDWLPDDILMKTDKISMAHSLEARVPFMDDLFIQASTALPDNMKIGSSGNKLALRRFASEILPTSVVSAPKRAFYVPLESYAQSKPLVDMFDWALDPTRVKRRGLFDPAWIAAQRAPGSDQGFLLYKRLFAILMLELWFDRFAPEASWA